MKGLFRVALCKTAGVCIWLLLVCNVVFAPRIAAQPAPQALSGSENIQGEFRILWGGPQPRTFEGSISIEGGTLRFVRNLSLEPTSIGRAHADGRSSIRIDAHAASHFGGIDVAIHAPSTSRLKVSFKDPLTENIVEHAVPLADVLSQNWTQPLDDRGARIAIERQVHDRIRVNTSVRDFVFDAGVQWEAEIHGVRTGLAPGQYVLRAQVIGEKIRPIPLLEQVITIEPDGDFVFPVPIAVPVPNTGGAYQLEISLHQRRFLNSILTSSAAIVRRVEFVSFDADAERPRITGFVPLARINALDASRPGMLSWLAPIGDSLPNISNPTPLKVKVPDSWQQLNPLARSLTQPISHGELGRRLTSIASDGQSRDSECLTLGANSWLAIPLEELEPDVPHRLVVRTPCDQPFRLVVSLKQADAQNALLPISQDYLIDHPKRHCRADGKLNEHEMLFWASPQKHFIVIANPNDELQASILDIQIERANLALPDQIDLEPDSENVQETERLSGIYLDKPLLSDFFGCARQVDSQTKRPTDSWQTWHRAFDRLEQYLDWTRSNVVSLKVCADGAAILPSDHLQPTVRYDNGVFWSDGRSPNIKDAVSLLMRYAERGGFKVILALDLDSPLPGLTRAQDSDIDTLFQEKLKHGIDQTLQEQLSYNPLGKRFQNKVRLAIQDIVARYGSYESFAGIQLQLDRNSQLLFRGDRWGYNQSLIADFQNAAPGKLPRPEDLPRAMAGTLRLNYLQWRAARLANFFEGLADIVRSGGNATLYLSAGRLWDNAPGAEDYHHPEAIMRNPAEYLLAHGIDPSDFEQHPNLVLMQGVHRRSRSSIDAQGWIRQVAQKSGLSSQTDKQRVSALLTRQPSVLHLPQFADFAKAADVHSASDVIYPLDMTTPDESRRDFVDQVFRSDTQLITSGAWLPQTSRSSAFRLLHSTFIDFPPVQLKEFPIKGSSSNVKVRVGTIGTRTFLQFVNNSPWEERIACAVQQESATAEPRLLGGRQFSLQQSTAGQDASVGYKTWRFSLNAWDLVGIEIDGNFRLMDVVHAPADHVMSTIASELTQLESIISQAADPTQQAILANIQGEFEQWTGEGMPVGWSVSSLPRTRIQRSSDLPHSGNSSLLIENANDGNVSAWIQSGAITAPETKRLAVQAWLRSPSVGGSSRIRVSVVGRTRAGVKFEKALELQSGTDPRLAANDWGTRPATLDVSDIPEDLHELFVAIELIGKGRIWVDDVKVLQSWLHPDETIYLQGTMFAAKQKLAENNPFPAEQLLDSHWGHYLSQFQPIRSDQLTSGNVGRQPVQTHESGRSNNWEDSPNLFQQLRRSMRERWRR